jgi:hypothetical protein
MALGITTGTVGVANATVSASIDDADTFIIQVSGTWAGTLTFEGSMDGTNWSVWTVVSSAAISHITAASTTTTNGLFMHETYGLSRIRVRFSTYTSGTATVLITATRTAK